MSDQKIILPSEQELLERERRLESLKALVNKIAHDFNNSLAPFTGWFSLIKEESPQDSITYLYAQKGEEVAKGVKNMLEEMMNSVSPERQFVPVEMDLKNLVEEELKRWGNEVPISVNLEVFSEISDCVIFSDPKHWRKAVANLLSNARYGLALGGRLDVVLKKEFLSSEQAQRLGILTNEPWVLIVKDNGLGIKKEILDKLFDPLFSTRSKNNALGLGLTHLHGLARLHGGQVVIQSEEEKGTCVFVWFGSAPIKKEVVTDRKDTEQVVERKTIALKDRKVLLVDDDPLVLEVLKMFLQRRGFDVIAFNSGKSALEMFKKRLNDFGMVVSDIRMEGMNGVEFVENIIKLKGDVPILFISGEKESILKSMMERLNNRFKVIKKPCTYSEFIRAVEEVLGGNC